MLFLNKESTIKTFGNLQHFLNLADTLNDTCNIITLPDTQNTSYSKRDAWHHLYYIFIMNNSGQF